jgi:hypothetical protein
MVKLLTEREFAENWRRTASERVKRFTWSHTAAVASDAFLEATRRTRQSGVQVASSGWLPRRRLAVLTPLPALPLGIADYNAKFCLTSQDTSISTST